jgi:hypothetical protein
MKNTNRLIFRQVDKPNPSSEKAEHSIMSETQLFPYVEKAFLPDIKVEEEASFEGAFTAGAFLQNMMRQIQTKQSEGYELIDKDGAKWTWLTKDGKEEEEIIPFYSKHREAFNDDINQEIDQHEAGLRQAEKEAELKKSEARKEQAKRKAIDEAAQEITKIYERILESHDISKVKVLDEELIDELLQNGYTAKPKPVYNTEDLPVAIDLTNPATKDVQTLNLILDREDTEEWLERAEREPKTFEELRTMQQEYLEQSRYEDLRSLLGEDVTIDKDTEVEIDQTLSGYGVNLFKRDDFALHGIKITQIGDDYIKISDGGPAFQLNKGHTIGEIKPSSELLGAVEITVLDENGDPLPRKWHIGEYIE